MLRSLDNLAFLSPRAVGGTRPNFSWCSEQLQIRENQCFIANSQHRGSYGCQSASPGIAIAIVGIGQRDFGLRETIRPIRLVSITSVGDKTKQKVMWLFSRSICLLRCRACPTFALEFLYCQHFCTIDMHDTVHGHAMLKLCMRT
jgi:hypothetical protein